uniref:Uncharacterized protein n=1 Tax=Kalanchoe fedtschenkoi TaxID=63787 RepID=A0A7N0RHL1_KALFE
MANALPLSSNFRLQATATLRPANSHCSSSKSAAYRKIVVFSHLRTSLDSGTRYPNLVVNASREDSGQAVDEEVDNLGVKAALSILTFYKREISPLLPRSCRYVPTCSEYSMQAYKKYGVMKGTVLTAWRICRCNPLGGTGFDPPRWFDEPPPAED